MLMDCWVLGLDKPGHIEPNDPLNGCVCVCVADKVP